MGAVLGAQSSSSTRDAPMKLTALKIKNTPPGAKPRKLADGLGLYLEIMPTDRRYWRLKYRYAGKENRLALGVYPEVSIKDARELRTAARKLLASNIDPSLHRRLTKISVRDAAGNSFEAVGREWFAKVEPQWARSHSCKVTRRLELYLYPYLGSRPVRHLSAMEVLNVLRRIEDDGLVETAHRVLHICDAVMRYAVVTGRADANPVGNLRGALRTVKEVHHATMLDPIKIGGLLRCIRGYKGSKVTRAALQLAPLLFVRPGELRKAEWSEIDLLKGVWRIPAEKMKMGSAHIVPLSSQSVAILNDMLHLTGSGQFVFPGVRSRKRPMSENTVNGALRNLGYGKEEITGHGFRSMASTLLNEMGFNRDFIERQLAHTERDSVRNAYNHAQYLAERTEMMQVWANHLDSLENGASQF